MEVLVGTLTVDLPSPSASSTPLYTDDSRLSVDGTVGGFVGGALSGDRVGEPQKFGVEDLSDSSSSWIGVPDDSENEISGNEAGKDEHEEVQSKFGDGLGSLDSLEDSLPVKRGLSSHFSGKSKSFVDLSQMTQVTTQVRELEKPENSFNKRRRLLVSSKMARRSFYSWSNPNSMPLLRLDEDEEEDNKYQDEKPRPETSPSLSQSLSLSSSSSFLRGKERW